MPRRVLLVVSAYLTIMAKAFSTSPTGDPSYSCRRRYLTFPIELPTNKILRKRSLISLSDHLYSAEDREELEDPFQFAKNPNDQRYSAGDWKQNMQSLNRSYILRSTRGPVMAVIVWSGLWSFLHRYFISTGASAAAARMCIDSKPHSFLVSVLGLLLVFRTNSAYQRFSEGRKIWEKISSASRTISRMLAMYSKEMGHDRQKRVSRLLASFPYLLHDHIRPRSSDVDIPSEYALRLRRASTPLRRDGKRKILQTFQEDQMRNVDSRLLPWSLFPPRMLDMCAQAPNRPLWVCDRLAEEFASIPYSDNYDSRERLFFFSQVDKLTHCLGACERIHQTAIPLNYARHSSRSLTLWLFTLPFCLFEGFGLLTAPVMGLAVSSQ